jgi:hypothetical protein
MPSKNVGSRRQDTTDKDVPAEGSKREAQDRARPKPGAGGARSPVDAMHVDAPKQQDNARGHRARPEREEE